VTVLLVPGDDGYRMARLAKFSEAYSSAAERERDGPDVMPCRSPCDARTFNVWINVAA
jgi:hypothetical protein